MRTIRSTGAVVVLLAGLAGSITACTSTTPPRESTGQYVDDSAITTKVKAKLASGEGVGSAARIHVETYKGVVQLSGYADSRDEVNRAIQIARNVEGVRGVDDSVAVKQ
jgi:osmotically-inducible protein OsmY